MPAFGVDQSVAGQDVRLGVLGIEGLTRLVYLKRKNKKMSSALRNTDLRRTISADSQRGELQGLKDGRRTVKGRNRAKHPLNLTRRLGVTRGNRVVCIPYSTIRTSQAGATSRSPFSLYTCVLCLPHKKQPAFIQHHALSLSPSPSTTHARPP